jgi:hypothetical protein
MSSLTTSAARIFLELVVHRGIAARCRLQLVEEVHHDLGHRQFVDQLHLAPVVGRFFWLPRFWLHSVITLPTYSCGTKIVT